MPAVVAGLELRRARSSGGIEEADVDAWRRYWQDAQGLAIAWAYEYLDGSDDDITSGEIEVLERRAGDYVPLLSALDGVRPGTYGFEASGRHLRLRLLIDPRPSEMDRLLQDEIAARRRRAAPAFLYPRLFADWFRSGDARAGVDPPSWLTSSLLRHCQLETDLVDPILPGGTAVDGFVLDDVRALWPHLLVRCRLAVTFASVGRTDRSLPAIGSGEFAAEVADATGADPGRIARAVDFLTFKSGWHPDPAIAPLLPHQGRLLLPASLILPSSFERNVLRSAALDPDLNGPLGQLLGGLAGKAAETLRLIPGARVASRVKVLRSNGDPAGDLDAVLLAADDSCGAIFEVKWAVDPDSATEVSKVDGRLREGQRQADRLRREIAAGSADVRMPPGWPTFDAVSWSWFVLAPSYLSDSTEIANGPVQTTSLRLIEYLLPKIRSVEGMIAALSTPPLPHEGTDWRVVESIVRVGDYSVVIEGSVPVESGPG